MRITLPRVLRRLWIAAMNLVPVCEAISPEYHDEPIERDTRRLRGLSDIQPAITRDNVRLFQASEAFLARRAQNGRR